MAMASMFKTIAIAVKVEERSLVSCFQHLDWKGVRNPKAAQQSGAGSRALHAQNLCHGIHEVVRIRQGA